MEVSEEELNAPAQSDESEHPTTGTHDNDNDNDAPPSSSSSAKSFATPMLSGEGMQDRLFQLRMKINQGRKANQSEVDEEFKRLSQSNRRKAKPQDDEEDKAVKLSPEEQLLNQTAQEAEWEAHKARKKAETAATYGLNAFTSDAHYRAYEKKVKKLASHRPPEAASSAVVVSGGRLEDNPLDYGKVGAKVSDASLDKLRADVVAREADRRKFSKRRLTTDGADVDYINDKNAAFNKKLKKAYNKYTVEIRQNLERGTAV